MTARRRDNQAKAAVLYRTFCKKPISEHGDERCSETARRRENQAKPRGGKEPKGSE